MSISAGAAFPSIPPSRQRQRTRGPLTVEWIDRVADIEQLESGWRELEAATTRRTVLATFDYNATWYRYYAGAGVDPLIGVVRRGGRLAGIAPLVARTRRIGRIPLRTIEFVPHEAYAGEFLVEDDSPETAAAFVESLAANMSFDVICLNGVDLDREDCAALRDVATRRRLGVEVTSHPNAMVDLRDGYDCYFSGRSAHFRQAVRRMGRRIDDAGGQAIEGVLLRRGLETLDDAVARMIAITEASHKLNGQRLADVHRGFLAELARRFGPRGMLALPILKVGNRDAAFVFGLVERGCFYDVTLSYDQAFSHLRVGTQLTQAMLRELAAAGVHTAISHGAHDYKEHWATAFVPGPRLFLFSGSVRAVTTRVLRFRLAPLWRRFDAPEP